MNQSESYGQNKKEIENEKSLFYPYSKRKDKIGQTSQLQGNPVFESQLMASPKQ